MKPLENINYIYIRKKRKTTGTCQQLEAPLQFTSRTPSSPLIQAIWIDDCLSTGTSLRDGVKLLLHDYNIKIVGAFFCVDRSVDRANIPEEEQPLLDPILQDVKIVALCDLKDVDLRIK